METNTLYNILIITFICIILLIYYWGAKRANYWEYQNVCYVKAVPFLGNLKDVLLQRKTIPNVMYDIYFDKKNDNQPIFGFQLFHKSALIIAEPELIKQVLVKDFNQFSNRYSKSNRHTDKMGDANLLFLRNPFWRYLRSRLSPTFTSAKLKNMFYLITDVGNNLNQYLKKINGNNEKINLDYQGLCARFTTDVIASCAFGVRANSIENPKSDFYIKGKSILDFTFFRSIELLSFFLLPQLAPICRFKFFGKTTENFMRSSIKHVMEEREQSGVIKHDLIDTLVQLKNEDKDKIATDDEMVLEGDVLVAQAVIFFGAGFSTTSTLILLILYELAMSESCQKQLRQEIKQNLLKNNGELTYAMVNGMEYLNMIIQETLRLHPTLPHLDRQCELSAENKNGYSLEPYHNFKIPNGMPILIPVFSLHRDPKHFPDPLKFDPERFSPENKHLIKPFTYLPFGGGPRNCIGERLGLLEVKVGIITILKNYYVLPTERTPRVMKYDRKGFALQPENKLYLKSVRDPLFT